MNRSSETMVRNMKPQMTVPLFFFPHMKRHCQSLFKVSLKGQVFIIDRDSIFTAPFLSNSILPNHLHHASPNPRAPPPPPHTLRLRKWLPHRKGQHRMPDCDDNRRIHGRHSRFLRTALPVILSSPNTINRRGQQLARPGLQLTGLLGRFRNEGRILGYIHSLKSRHLTYNQSHANYTPCVQTANFRVDRTSTGDPYVLGYANCISLLGQAMTGNGSDGLFGPNCEFGRGESFGGWGNTDFGTVFAEAICPINVHCLPWQNRPLGC